MEATFVTSQASHELYLKTYKRFLEKVGKNTCTKPGSQGAHRHQLVHPLHYTADGCKKFTIQDLCPMAPSHDFIINTNSRTTL
jgi:hypothetical protein